MIKFENTIMPSADQWKAIIFGARNPLNSWDRYDSHEGEEGFNIGPKDYDLMKRLRNAGTDHRKFMRMIPVYVDITAPVYWLAELDTYKIGTVRNSCSFMHKGTSRPFNIDDFSLKDERIYKALRPLERKTYELSYPYETSEYRLYTDHNGRSYRVYRNGFVVRQGFNYRDNYGTGRTRHFDDSEATIYQNKSGYFVIKLSGRNGGQMLLHRLVAKLWCDKPDGCNYVNHKDGNKGNNSAENLEWTTAKSNMEHGIKTGLFDELGGIHHRYRLWKHNIHIIPIEKRMEFKQDCDLGLTYKELADKWDITPNQANCLRYDMQNYDYEDLFQECYVWDRLIEQLNYLRAMYLETKDEKIFQAIRSLLPQAYMQKSTYMLNYEVLANMYKSRKHHRLDEWHDFCDWIKTLPYSELITGEFDKEN